MGTTSACRAGSTATRDFFELEKRSIFRTSWQLVCHSNDIPEIGDYHRFDLLGESVVTVRGKDGTAAQLPQRLPPSRLAPARRPEGQLRQPDRLPVSRLELLARRQADRRAAARRRSAISTWSATAWSRSSRKSSWASCSCASSRACRACARWRRRTRDELAAYRMEELVPQGRVTLRPRQVNWKNVADNYSDGMHIPVAHPGLTRLFARSYAIEAQDWIDKMSGVLQEQVSSNWSERLYQQLLPPVAHSAAGAAAPVDLFQAVAERRVRHLSRPDRLHAVHPGVAHRRPDPRDRVRASRQPSRDARGALSELAHQPAGQRRGQDADRARAGRHGSRAATPSGR